MGNGSTVRDGGSGDPQGAGIGIGADYGGASPRNDRSGLLERGWLAWRQGAIAAGNAFGDIWFHHQIIGLALFVSVYAPLVWGLWWLHNDHVWLAAVLGAVAFWATLKITIALAVVQTVSYYQNQQQMFFDNMQAQALAQMPVDEGKAN